MKIQVETDLPPNGHVYHDMLWCCDFLLTRCFVKTGMIIHPRRADRSVGISRRQPGGLASPHRQRDGGLR
jgi:hypothetical protein